MDIDLEIKTLLDQVDSVEQSIRWLKALKEKKEYNDTVNDIDKLIESLKTKLDRLQKALNTRYDELVQEAEVFALAEG